MREYEQSRETWDGRDTSELIGDFIDVGDRVLVRFIWRGVGQGPEAALDLTTIWTVRNGSIVPTYFFHDYAQALESAGLRE